MPLVSLSQVKAQLNIPASDTSNDVELQSYVDAATFPVEEACGRVIDQRAVTDELVVRGSCFLLRSTPVVSLTSVAAVDGSQTWDVNALHLDNKTGEVTALSGPAVQGRIQVNYVAGVSTVPPNVQLAALIIIQHLWETQRGTMGVQLGGDNETYVAGRGFAVPRRALELLGGQLPGVA
ncbi:phage gp6-like head-tail connector protein [Streptomyces asiaticus]|uniref:phage gp6-like head-tail connector protein n=1 Tax=Streptomyces asiaticus TaxID=114695 RepID=UPI001BA52D66|nr:phage gp6-like head-tail connector protein [Streptomyces asiaticus]